MPMPAERLRYSCLHNIKQRGFTLIELIITIIVTAIAFTALSVWMLGANRDSVDPVISMRAATLGQAYLEEILSKRFDEQNSPGGIPRCNDDGPACTSAANFGPDGETREFFDDVDDYHGLSESPPRNNFGNARSQYNNFSVAISVNYDGGTFGLPVQELKRIEVTVRTPSGFPFVFTAYRGNF